MYSLQKLLRIHNSLIYFVSLCSPDDEVDQIKYDIQVKLEGNHG
jgi:hypothetical protein